VFLLGFSQVLGFFFFGFRGSCWGFLGLVWVLFRGFYCITEVTNGGFYCMVEVLLCLLGVFLWVPCGFSWVFYVG
jgi:hypothetical protein